ncbi:MAG: response regulator [Terriglobales bacterium]
MEIRTKVVLVEDDEDIRVLAEKALRGGGYEVFSAADGESGLQLVKEKRPAPVILDLMMPRMQGFTVCQAGCAGIGAPGGRGAVGLVPPRFCPRRRCDGPDRVLRPGVHERTWHVLQLLCCCG